MSRIFDPENGFFTTMGKIWDLIWLSILWTVTSLAVVTMFTASASMYYAVVKVIRRGRGYVTRSFFHAFKENAKQGIILNIIALVAAVILYVDFRYAEYLRAQGNTLGTVFLIVFTCITFFLCFLLVWVNPILSRFKLTLKQLIMDTLLISIRHFPTTFIMVAALVGIVYLLYTYLPYIIVYGLFVIIPSVLPGVFCFLRSLLVERILKKYTPEAEGTEEETGQDRWYLE